MPDPVYVVQMHLMQDDRPDFCPIVGVTHSLESAVVNAPAWVAEWATGGGEWMLAGVEWGPVKAVPTCDRVWVIRDARPGGPMIRIERQVLR